MVFRGKFKGYLNFPHHNPVSCIGQLALLIGLCTPTSRSIQTVKDVVKSVQRDNLQDGDSLHIDVRRWCFIDDAIREGKKTKFDLNKRLRVSVSC